MEILLKYGIHRINVINFWDFHTIYMSRLQKQVNLLTAFSGLRVNDGILPYSIVHQWLNIWFLQFLLSEISFIGTGTIKSLKFSLLSKTIWWMMSSIYLLFPGILMFDLTCTVVCFCSSEYCIDLFYWLNFGLLFVWGNSAAILTLYICYSKLLDLILGQAMTCV